jgi:hypothetical protein
VEFLAVTLDHLLEYAAQGPQPDHTKAAMSSSRIERRHLHALWHRRYRRDDLCGGSNAATVTWRSLKHVGFLQLVMTKLVRSQRVWGWSRLVNGSALLFSSYHRWMLHYPVTEGWRTVTAAVQWFHCSTASDEVMWRPCCELIRRTQQSSHVALKKQSLETGTTTQNSTTPRPPLVPNLRNPSDKRQIDVRAGAMGEGRYDGSAADGKQRFLMTVLLLQLPGALWAAGPVEDHCTMDMGQRQKQPDAPVVLETEARAKVKVTSADFFE